MTSKEKVERKMEREIGYFPLGITLSKDAR